LFWPEPRGTAEPRMQRPIEQSGGPNEVWSYGDRPYEIIKDLLFLRGALALYP